MDLLKQLVKVKGSLRKKSTKGKDRAHLMEVVDWAIPLRSHLSPPATRLQNGSSKTSIIIHGDKLLRDDDCKMLIESAEELGFSSVEWEYTKDYRDCKRVVVKAPKLASSLWKKVAPYLTPSDLNVRPYGFDNDGFWAPVGLNDCVRVVKYEHGGHFQPHKDGAFVLDDDTRSVYTLQIYLNEGFQGGKTIFYDESNPPQALEVQPAEGSFLIFNHDVMHMGEAVQGNVPKYIIRMDIMFRREPTNRASQRDLLPRNPEFLRMDALYKKSIALQRAGDPRGSTQAYLAAQKIQASFPSVQARSGNQAPPLGWVLGFDISLQIFELLSLGELAKAARVCKGWNGLVNNPSLWRRLYFLKWPQIAKVESLMEVSAHLLDYAKPWKEAFRQRLEADKNFRAIFFDIGSQTTRFGMVGEPDVVTRPESYYLYSHYPRDGPAMEPPEIPSVTAQVRGHYWSAREGLEDYLVGPQVSSSHYPTYLPQNPFVRTPKNKNDLDAFVRRELKLGDDDGPGSYYRYHFAPEDHTISTNEKFMIHWNVIRNLCKFLLAAGFGSPQTTVPHPILFALPPFFQAPEERMLEYVVRNRLDARDVAFVSSSFLVLLATGKKTGLVVSSGHLVTAVTPIWEGTPIFDCEAFFPHAGVDLLPFKEKKAVELAEKVEALFFSPEVPELNLARLALDVVLKCEEGKRQALLDHVVLCGGNTFDIEDRFRKEFAQLVSPTPYTATTQVPEDRLTAVTLGAKLFCSFSGVRDLFG